MACEVALHGGDGVAGNVGEGALLAGVDEADGGCGGVNEEDRSTVGTADDEREVRNVGDEGIDAGNLFDGNVGAGDEVAVRLFGGGEAGVAEGMDEAGGKVVGFCVEVGTKAKGVNDEVVERGEWRECLERDGHGVGLTVWPVTR